MANEMAIGKARAKLCRDGPPKNSMESTIICVEPCVMTVREMVWVMAPLMISRVEALRCLRKFSRIRSMMITDSLTEYPRTASTPASTDSENSHWKNAKNPRMINTSCRLAITPDTANYQDRKSVV